MRFRTTIYNKHNYKHFFTDDKTKLYHLHNTFLNLHAQSQNMTRVVVFGTFDMLHKGHESLFEQAKKFGDELFVVVARDINVRKGKLRAPVHNENERLASVKENTHVTNATLGHEHDNRYQVIEEIQPDVICIGYDQKTPPNFEQTLFDKNINAKVVKLKAYFPEKWKTTKLRED